jgi:cytochrome c peroxidase
MKYLVFVFTIIASLQIHSVGFGFGYGKLNFEAPVAGTYKLHPLGKAGDGEVLTVNNSEKTLHDLYDDKIVLLGFVYLSCDDVKGCPLTTFVMGQIKSEIDKINDLSDNVRLLSLSFDPQRDTPSILKKSSMHTGSDEQIWSLVTTKNQHMLNPILKKYSQPIQRIYDKDGKSTGKINHILRVFLIDKNKQIRNIYTNSFLHKDIVLSDIKTLLLEENSDFKFVKTDKEQHPHSHGH